MNRREFLRNSTLALGAPALGTPFMIAAAEPAATGRQFYLDGEAGNDAAPGSSPQQAWRSIAKLNATRFQPGDHIYFNRGGSYAGQFHPQGSGSAGRPIVVDCYGNGELPHIHAYGKAQASLYLHNVEYWTVRNLQISNKGPSDQPNRAGVYVNHEDFGVAHGIILEQLQVHDVNGSLLKKQGGGAGIMVNAFGKQRPTRYEGLQITGCSVVNTQRNGILFLAAGSRQGGLGKNVIVRGNRIEQVPGDCILVVGCDGAVVEHNTVSGCPPLPAGEAAAGIWPFNCDNTLIQYNEVSGHQAHADGEAYDADLACCRTVIQYNYSHDNGGGLALICNKGGENLGAGNNGTVVRYNVSINDALRPSGAAVLHVTGPVNGSEFYNNIIIIPRRTLDDAQAIVFKADNWTGVPIGTAIHDNIIVSALAPGIDMKRATHTKLGENRFYADSGLAPAGQKLAAHVDPEILEQFSQNRPSLSEVIALVKACFANGKPVLNAQELIAKL